MTLIFLCFILSFRFYFVAVMLQKKSKPHTVLSGAALPFFLLMCCSVFQAPVPKLRLSCGVLFHWSDWRRCDQVLIQSMFHVPLRNQIYADVRVSLGIWCGLNSHVCGQNCLVGTCQRVVQGDLALGSAERSVCEEEIKSWFEIKSCYCFSCLHHKKCYQDIWELHWGDCYWS